MKAEELMVGDLVTFKGYQEDETPSIIEIVGIGYQGEDKEDCLVRIDGSDACDIIRIDDEIVGVPLTPEILEKNGFKYNDEEEYDDCIWSDGNIMLRLEYGFRIVVINDFDDESTNRTPFVLRYVHQLQHVYKLLGIDKEITVC